MKLIVNKKASLMLSNNDNITATATNQKRDVST
jgi:hypothetical protein